MYEYRKLLECFAAEKVAATATPEQIEELRSIVAPEIAPHANLNDILRANTQFHRRLSELAGNERVTSQLQLTLGYVSRLDTLCTQNCARMDRSCRHLRAIETHQAADARTAMEAHIDSSRNKMISLFGR